MRELREEVLLDRHLRFHERTNRFSLGMLILLGAGLLAVTFGRLPREIAAYLRTALLLGFTALGAVEALRHLRHGQLPGGLRWTRLTIGAAMGALGLAQALRHWSPIEGATPDKVLGLGVAFLSFSLLVDLRELQKASRADSLVRSGIIVGAIGTALMGTALLGEARLPWSVWWPLFLTSAMLVAVAGGIYLRVRSARADSRAA